MNQLQTIRAIEPLPAQHGGRPAADVIEAGRAQRARTASPAKALELDMLRQAAHDLNTAVETVAGMVVDFSGVTNDPILAMATGRSSAT